MEKLTEQQIREKVKNNSLNTCEYIDGYINSQSTIQIKCLIHNNIFSTKYENVRRDNRKHLICPLCQQEKREAQKIILQCDYCGEDFFKPKSKINSKSGFNFCCREHKDLAQSLASGPKFSLMRPKHYSEEESQNYRKKAFVNQNRVCAVCGWAEDEDILEVHHLDENRSNNKIENLMILCPICHRKLTSQKYTLKNNQIILKS